ncbi:CPBP family intramembrane glutamic endopeptidase [Clostridium minihomine]|uniref:CPBP family intramembrane glutamic endopeptidase n=1 Tax=Clostridium minihomine TaxID=2045012 RepID=UPI000C7759B8|nr:type II CAAX endopeptidase family protein [Clostridium minihomine]
MKQQPPGYPPDLSRHSAVFYEKKILRWESNYLCLLLISIQILVTTLSLFAKLYVQKLGLMGYPLDAFQGYPPILYFLAHGSLYLVGMTIPVFLYWGIRRQSPSQQLLFERVKLSTFLLMTIFGVGICTTANIPSSMVAALQKALGYSGRIPDLPLNENPWVQVLFFVSLAIIPPLTEELLFRGAILSGLRRFGDHFAIVGSAFLFAVYHGNFTQMVFAFLCGLVLAFAVIKTGNLWIAILIHAINNGTSVLFQLMQFYTSEATANTFYLFYFIGTALAGVLALIILSIRDKQLFRLKPSESVLTLGQKFRTMLWNPAGVALLSIGFISAFYVLENF